MTRVYRKINFVIVFAIAFLFLFSSGINAEDQSLISINAKAHGFYVKGNYDSAFYMYKRGISLHPRYAPFYDGLANVCLKKKQYQLAYINYSAASKLDPGNSLYKVHAQKAIYSACIDTIEDSKSLFAKAIGLTPDSITISKNIENIMNNKFRDLGMIMEYSQSSENNYLTQGNTALGDKKYQEAIQFYTKSLKSKSSLYRAYNNIGIVYCKLKDYKQAAKYFNLAIKTDPTSSSAYNNKAVCNIGDTFKNINDSIKYLQTIVKYEPENIPAKTTLGLFFFLNEDYPSAIQTYESAFELVKDNTEILKKLAEFSFANGEYKKSIGYYKKIIFINDNDSSLFLGIAKACEKNGDFRNAFINYQASLGINPDNAETYKFLGYFLVSQKRKSEAKGILKKYLELSPNCCDYILVQELLKKI